MAQPQPERSILDVTLAASVRDKQLATPDGTIVQQLTHGVQIRHLTTHADLRGSVTELFDPRWGWHPDPLVFSYFFTIRPGVAKGWNLHREHEDRYVILFGELELVFYDPRPDSPTCGKVSKVVMSENRRCLVNVPKNVWHADHNIGTKDAVVVNYPTIQYDHTNPDKYRLPLDTDLIPYKFPNAIGW
jgi:dTDP-4-dehydrorhamnose 3,5-epimerase